MSAEYDAIVVGARCAGAPTAMLLARLGHRVLVVDRARFPSDTVSTHWIHQPGVARLRDWGLLDRVVATGCPPGPTLTIDFGPFVISGRPRPADGVGVAYAPRRTVLDEILVRAAAGAGAEVRQEFAVRELLTDDGVVTGIRGQTRGGQTVTERARIVIGADGLHSVVARLVGAPRYRDRGVLAALYYAYWSGVPVAGFEAWDRGRRMVACLPTNDDLTLVLAVSPRSEFEVIRHDVEPAFLAALDEAPALADRVGAGTRESRFSGSGMVGNFFRLSHGPGWALVGDAGLCKDPITGQGISDAFDDAASIAPPVADGLSGARSLDASLAAYETQRNRKRQGMFDFTCQLATRDQPPPPDLQRLLAAVSRSQEAMDEFASVIAGTEPVERFLASDHVAELVAEPARAS